MELLYSVIMMDSVFSKIGEEQSSEDAEDGPPELLVGDVSRSLSGGQYDMKPSIWTTRWVVQMKPFSGLLVFSCLQVYLLSATLVHSWWPHGQDIRLLLEPQ